MSKEIVYVDMDDVQCDFAGAYYLATLANPEMAYPQAQMDFFRKLRPIKGAIEGVNALREKYDVWTLTKPSVINPLCYTEKRLWIQDHYGFDFCKKLILCPNKSLLKGHYLIDDKPWPFFEGEQILFGGLEYPNWDAVLKKLL